jgi:RES domain-containing protein
MRLWRISNHADLSGEGGLRAGGRWHSKGRRVVYLADHPASALIEMLAHLEIDVEDFPADYQLLSVDCPDDVAVTALDVASLPVDWRQQTLLTRARGDDWRRANASALLRVPSTIVPSASNSLLNPAHPDAKLLVIGETVRAAFDPRLL